MRHRQYDLPPLDQLEAFEAAARHLSFTRAADELALTQSAVSRQVAALEAFFGVALFQRLHRALRLSDRRPAAAAHRGRGAAATAPDQHRAARRGAAEDGGGQHHRGLCRPVADPAAGWLHRVAARRGRAHLGHVLGREPRARRRRRGHPLPHPGRRRGRRPAPVRRGGAAGVRAEAAPRCRAAVEAARGSAPPLSAAPGQWPGHAIAGMATLAARDEARRPEAGQRAALLDVRPADPGRRQRPGRRVWAGCRC